MPAPEPLTKAEPVALLDLVKLVIVAVGYLGVQVPEDTAMKVGAAIVALYAFVQATWFTRKAVTPVARADAREGAALAQVGAGQAAAAVREQDAYADGLAVGEHEQPQATIVQVATDPPDLDRLLAALKSLGADVTNTDIDQVAPPPPSLSDFGGGLTGEGPAKPSVGLVGLPIDWGNAADVPTRRP